MQRMLGSCSELHCHAQSASIFPALPLQRLPKPQGCLSGHWGTPLAEQNIHRLQHVIIGWKWGYRPPIHCRSAKKCLQNLQLTAAEGKAQHGNTIQAMYAPIMLLIMFVTQRNMCLDSRTTNHAFPCMMAQRIKHALSCQMKCNANKQTKAQSLSLIKGQSMHARCNATQACKLRMQHGMARHLCKHTSKHEAMQTNEKMDLNMIQAALNRPKTVAKMLSS